VRVHDGPAQIHIHPGRSGGEKALYLPTNNFSTHILPLCLSALRQTACQAGEPV